MKPIDTIHDYLERIRHEFEPFGEVDMFVFVDKMGVSLQEARMMYGWAQKGWKVRVPASKKRGDWYSSMAACNVKELLLVDSWQHTTTSDDVEKFITRLAEQMFPFPNRSSVLVLDNPPVHTAIQEEIEEVVEGKGAKVLWLPAHFPDGNFIE